MIGARLYQKGASLRAVRRQRVRVKLHPLTMSAMFVARTCQSIKRPDRTITGGTTMQQNVRRMLVGLNVALALMFFAAISSAQSSGPDAAKRYDPSLFNG